MMRWFFVTAFILICIPVLPLKKWRQSWTYTKSVDVDRSVYYRLKVSLTYKGQPQLFNIVVGCNVKRIHYKDGSSTREDGMVPDVFGRRMSDGRGLVINVPEACGGEVTATGQVPPDLLPVVVVYEDADTLAFGTAYLSEDAYESPLSLLRFGGATIETATREEFEAFRRDQPNLITPGAYYSAGGRPPDGINGVAVPFARGCHGYARFRLVGDARSAAQALWPADRPRYWEPKWEARDKVFPKSGPLRTDHDGAEVTTWGKLVSGLDNEVAKKGMPTRSGTGRIARGRSVMYPPSYYPDAGPWGGPPWPKDVVAAVRTLVRDGPRIKMSIDVREGMTRGFAYCWNWLSRIDQFSSSPPDFGIYNSLTPLNLVDGINEFDRPVRSDRPVTFVELDEFLYKRFAIGLGSTRGAP